MEIFIFYLHHYNFRPLGDLLELILIQVQKSKVDLQIAMSALDQLLRSNELNFEVMAIVPTLLILYMIILQGKSAMRHFMGTSKSQTRGKLKQEFHAFLEIFAKDPSVASIDDEFAVGGRSVGSFRSSLNAVQLFQLIRIYELANSVFQSEDLKKLEDLIKVLFTSSCPMNSLAVMRHLFKHFE